MISDKILNNGEVKKTFRIFKSFYGIFLPLSIFFTVACGILSLFESASGTNAKSFCLIVFICGIILNVALVVGEKLFEKNKKYTQYQPKSARIFPLSTYLPLILLTIIIVVPFYILVLTSFKASSEANQLGFTWWPKQGFHLDAYKLVLSTEEIIGVSIVRSFLNSLLYTLVPVTVGLFMSALSAYGFAKLDCPIKTVVFEALLLTIMLPGSVTLSSRYVLFDMIGWIDTQSSVSLALLIPGCFGGITTVMFLREFFRGIPDDIIMSANIDGAGKMKIFFSFMLPLGKPALIAQFILGFVGVFNDYLGPLLYTGSAEQYTLQVALKFFDGEKNVADLSSVAAGSVLAILPIFSLYLVFQNKILNGISMSSGLKG